ncbi:hypothetical protein DCAR_0832813 [Daucus carota subsp. sativus]|uniref:Uncharacterized protein n=1 Tax=Daucus carota subsp. sativus TaxID=79200 RepID=A0AAF0XUC5_DAUCS|nr:hypothetical protein DCAR_0832813 [Daucus carota subsp. sativus]
MVETLSSCSVFIPREYSVPSFFGFGSEKGWYFRCIGIDPWHRISLDI